MVKKLLIVHPYDKSTQFLERIKNYLQSEFENNTHYFSVKPTDSSHNLCLETISSFSENGLVFFMGHGKSNCLYGAKGALYASIENEEVKHEDPEKYYYNENFINTENINVFKNKKVIALSCNSNEQVGREAVIKGAKVFLGFGDLPTSIGELKDKGEKGKTGISLATIEQALKTDINDIIKKSISIGIHKNYTFSQLQDLIYFITNQKISSLLVDQKNINERKLIANYLYSFKKEIKIYGDKNEKLIFNLPNSADF